jgi:hypothetical protein
LQKSAQAAYANDIALQKTAEATRSNANSDYESTIAKLKQIGVLLAKPAVTTSAQADHPGGGAKGTGQSDKDTQKTAQAKSAFLQAQADNELAILKLKNQLEEAEDQRHLSAGTLTLDQYYAQREARIKAEADAELAILATKQKAVAALPDTTPEQDFKRQQAAAAVQTQITETQIKEQAQLAANADSFAKAKHDAALAELNDQEKLQKLSGDKYTAEETALQIELQQYTELLQKQNKSTDQIDAAVSAYKTKAQASIDFGRNQEAGSSAMTNMNLGIGSIQNQAADGSISNISAQTQINQLQKDMQLWSNLQAVLKSDLAEFNEEHGDAVMRTKALGDGTFEVHLGEPGGAERIAALTYDPDSTTLSWHVFGGAKGRPLVVGLKTVPQGQGIDELLFTSGQSYPSVEEISQQIISELLPC